MKILLWTEAFWPSIGGSEVAITTLIHALRARGQPSMEIREYAGL